MGEREICLPEFDRYDWLLEIEADVESLLFREAQGYSSIYKLPEESYGSDEKRSRAYKPQFVSLGPYHHGEDHLQPTEEHKRRALYNFLSRTRKSIREYLYALWRVVKQLMESYKDLDGDWKDEEEIFLRLMIFDGCFMLELLRTNGSSTLQGYDEDDPIFSHHGLLWNKPRIKRDMLMVENQIPLLVLKTLLSVERGGVDYQDEENQGSLNQTVNNMVLKFFGLEEEYSPRDEMSMNQVELGLHALDVVRKSMIKYTKGGKKGETEAKYGDVIWPATQLRPATQLQEAGIKFWKSGSPSLKDIHFSRGYLHPNLSLPQLVVDDATESKFLNLMAFEHLHVGSGNEVSSYVAFMAFILHSEKDVSLLSQNDIIMNFMGTDQAVADLFHRISRDVSIDTDSELSTVHMEVTEYCNRPIVKPMAKFRRGWHKYFYSRWVLVSSVGATLVLVITFMQLVYAMLDFYND